MIWALIALAALPLLMASLMLLLLRSGRLRQLRQQGRDAQVQTSDGSGLEAAAAAGWSVAPTDSPFAGGRGEPAGSGATGSWEADTGGDSGGGGGDGGGSGGDGGGGSN